MGNFFNRVLLNQKKFPVSKDMERMRQDFNASIRQTSVPVLLPDENVATTSLAGETTVGVMEKTPEQLLKEKRQAQMAKARAARKVKSSG